MRWVRGRDQRAPPASLCSAHHSPHLGRSASMPRVSDVMSMCSTASVRGLSRQIIAEMNLLVPSLLVTFTELAVDIADDSVNAFGVNPSGRTHINEELRQQRAPQTRWAAGIPGRSAA